MRIIFTLIILLVFITCIVGFDRNEMENMIVRKVNDARSIDIQRIADLEQTVKEQQQMIKKLLTNCPGENCQTAVVYRKQPRITEQEDGINNPSSDIPLRDSDIDTENAKPLPVTTSQSFENERIRRNCLQSRQVEGQVAFYAVMTSNEPHPGLHQTLVFDSISINLGNSYNKHSGIFFVPEDGYYVFTWTIVCTYNSVIYTEIVKNSSPFGSLLTNSEDIHDQHTTSTSAITELAQGDIIFIRINPSSHQLVGGILSDKYHRTSFSGWKLF